MERIPDRIPTETVDRMIAASFSRGNWTVQLELDFDRSLDSERLARAADLALDAEPVLGCRFEADRRRPVWQRLGSEDRTNFVLAGSSGDYEALKVRAVDIHNGPQLRATLWQRPGGDRLALALSHAVADGGGLLDTAEIVARIYTRLADDPGFRPEPNLHGSRSVRQVLRHVPWRAYPRIARSVIEESRQARPGEPWLTLPIEPGGPETSTGFVSCHIPADRVAGMAGYARERGATLNDLLLAAFFRALVAAAGWDGQRRLMVFITAGLRRYLPGGKAAAVCNLSSIQAVRLGTDLGADLDATMGRVSAIMKAKKANWIGLFGPSVVIPLVRHLPFWLLRRIAERATESGSGVRPLIFTNAGVADPDRLRFDAPPVMVWACPQLLRPPRLQVAVLGYRGALTLVSGVYPSRNRESAAVRLFDSIVAELADGVERIL